MDESMEQSKIDESRDSKSRVVKKSGITEKPEIRGRLTIKTHYLGLCHSKRVYTDLYSADIFLLKFSFFTFFLLRSFLKE